MKKATHIAALPVLTALLAACAAPVEQGRIDRIEGAATALADQTLVAGLVDDFAEVEKQWKEAEGLKLEGKKLVDGLEDDFAEIKEQVSKVGKETDLADKVASADELKKKLEMLANELATRLDAAKLASKLASAKDEGFLYRELKYTFRNLDAVKLTEKKREKYVSDLQDRFIGFAKRSEKYKESGKYDLGRLDSEEYKRMLSEEYMEKLRKEGGYKDLGYNLDQIEYKPAGKDGKWSFVKPTGEGDLAGIQFSLSNLERGVAEIQREGIELFIAKVTDENQVEDIATVGVPVVGIAAPPKPVTFATLAVNYSSASGAGAGFVPEVQAKVTKICPEVTAPYQVTTKVKQEDAFVSIYDEKKVWIEVEPTGSTGDSVTFADSITFKPSPEDGKGFVGTPCEWRADRKAVYIAVLLKEETPQGEFYVAEYHTLEATIEDTTEDTPPEPKTDATVERGRLTKDLPACPPEKWEEAGELFVTAVLEKSQREAGLKEGCV